MGILDHKRRINSLGQADLENLSLESVGTRLGLIMNQYHIQMHSLILSGIFRARRNEGANDFAHVSQLWYPPADNIRKYGRLNNIGQSLLYASNTPQTAIYELKHAVGDRITVLIIRPKENVVSFENIAFIGLEQSTSNDISNTKRSENLRNSTTFRNSLTPQQFKKWIITDNFLKEVLAQEVSDGDEFKYKTTVALSELLFRNPNLDAINYSSIATHSNGINLCMLPEKADEHFRGSEAWVIDIKDIGRHPETNEILYQTDFVKRSQLIEENGEIEWLPDGVGINSQSIATFMRGPAKNLDKPPA